MKKRILTLTLVLCMLLSILPVTAMAAATNVVVKDATFHDNGALASITATFGWSTASAKSQLVLMDKLLRRGDKADPDN